MLLVFDCSGSMTGDPIHLSKRAGEALLGKLRPDDRFNIISFSMAASWAARRSLSKRRM